MTDFAWTRNLVENLRLTTKKGLSSTNIPWNYPLSMIPNLLGFVRKLQKNKTKTKQNKTKKSIQPAHSSDSHMIILPRHFARHFVMTFAFPHKQKLSSSLYASKTSKLSSNLRICRRRRKNLYRKPPPRF